MVCATNCLFVLLMVLIELTNFDIAQIRGFDPSAVFLPKNRDQGRLILKSGSKQILSWHPQVLKIFYISKKTAKFSFHIFFLNFCTKIRQLF